MKEKEEKQRIRKEFKRGERTQKMMTFRVDNDVAKMLSTCSNKGRLINNLVRDYFTNKNWRA